MPTGRESVLREMREQELKRAKKIVEVNIKILKAAREEYRRLLEDEFREAKGAGRHLESGDIAIVINHIKKSLKAAESAMEDLIGVETDEIIKRG